MEPDKTTPKASGCLTGMDLILLHSEGRVTAAASAEAMVDVVFVRERMKNETSALGVT